jgi:hypothetical protein
MKFDIILGNPPYNLRKDGGGERGTKGDNVFFKKFVTLGMKGIKKDTGTLCLVTPKGVIKHLDKLGAKVESYNHMCEDYWKYSTLYFIARNTNADVDTKVISDDIISKVYKAGDWNDFGIFSKTKTEIKEYWVENGLEVIGYISSKDPKELEYPMRFVNANNSLVVPGPKFACSQLESVPSYTATDKPMLLANAHYYRTETVEEAEAIKLFLTNNKFMQYLKVRFNLKATHIGFKYIKKFDLKQIVTGEEYPKEWNFTKEDIASIEEFLRLDAEKKKNKKRK